MTMATITAALLAAITSAITFFVLWRQAQEEAKRHRIRAEENFRWEQKALNEAIMLRQRLNAVERRHVNLQLLYAELTRKLLAKNYYIIRQHVRSNN